MHQALESIVNPACAPLADAGFRARCKQALDEHGALELPRFLLPSAIFAIQKEGEEQQHLAHYTAKQHNIYLSEPDPVYAPNHARNRLVSSSKGCITDDQVPAHSLLRALYDAPEFRQFLCTVLGEAALYPYADPLSSINIHYASEGQELGWHFDNSSFAITLLIQKPTGGGDFEFVKDIRGPITDESNSQAIQSVMDGKAPVQKLVMEAGTLVLFRGRNSMHRVTPVVGDRTRMLVVLAYNNEPGISLAASAQMTFYGRMA